MRVAASQYGVPKSTLHDRVSGRVQLELSLGLTDTWMMKKKKWFGGLRTVPPLGMLKVSGRLGVL